MKQHIEDLVMKVPRTGEVPQQRRDVSRVVEVPHNGAVLVIVPNGRDGD